jgi:hypothetical protein
MFGMNNKITTKADTTNPSNPFEEMKRAIYAAISAAEDAGVPHVAIRNFVDGLAVLRRQRSDFLADQANRMSPEVIAAEAARHRRAEQQLERERQEYRAAVTRAAEAEDERRWSR